MRLKMASFNQEIKNEYKYINQVSLLIFAPYSGYMAKGWTKQTHSSTLFDLIFGQVKCDLMR